MGYPMTYSRVVGRNNLGGGYKQLPSKLPVSPSLIAGDLRRFERDVTDDAHVRIYAEAFGCSPDQARRGLRRLLGLEDLGAQVIVHYLDPGLVGHHNGVPNTIADSELT